MTLLPSDVTAVILAGGHSTRFGRDKGLAVWRGQRLVDHVLGRLPAHRADTVLVIRHDQDEGQWPTVRIVHDNPAVPAGPLRGLIDGLAACRTAWAWVVACDQPLIQPALLTGLLTAAPTPSQALIPRWKGRLQPLTGLYPTSAGPRFEDALAAGERSLIGALETVGFTSFDEDRCRLFDSRGWGFLNANRPADLAELEGCDL